MEFNAIAQQQQLRPPSNRSLNASRNVAQIMFPYGGFPSQNQAAQSIPRATQPPSNTWSLNGAAPTTYNPLHRRSLQGTTSIPTDGRTATSDLLAPPRPTSMTAQSLRGLGLNNHTAMQSDMLQNPSLDPNNWNQKACDNLEFPSLDPDMADLGQGLLHNDENTPIIDLRQYTDFETGDAVQDAYRANLSRRMSESSFSMSSTGPLAEVPTYEDFSTSEMSSYPSDCEAWNSLEPNQTLMSPMASPRHPKHEIVRHGSRSRSSPAPHNNMRTSPYTMESTRNKRWSTGMYGSNTTPRQQHHFNNRFSFYGSPLNPQHSSVPTFPDMSANFQNHTQNILYSQPPHLQSSNATVFSNHDQPYPEAPRPLPSQGLFRLLQSNADRHTGCASHFADLSDPPDLYSSLHEEPCNPPESDMHPSDPDLTPHEQDLRFTGDLYTPRWVRGHGNKREGWCGLCKPGRWLVLKNSAFWYDKSFTHGVSAATGAAFQGPQVTRRTEGNLDVWEGLCGSCSDWIPLVSSKKKGTTWFRHAYKCHTHPKVRDGPKRRRETSSSQLARARASSVASSVFRSKDNTASTNPDAGQTPNESIHSNDTVKEEREATPQRSSASMSMSATLSRGTLQDPLGLKSMNPLQGLASMI